jgi:hypothetical protein
MHKKRKSSTPLSDAIAEMLASSNPNDPKGRTNREAIQDSLAQLAAAGSKAAARELVEWDRAFGPRPKKA